MVNRRRSGLAAACGLLALGGLTSAAVPARSDGDPAGKTVSIDVAAGDLHAVVSMLERQANVEASVRDGDKPYKPVYVHLDGASLPKALRTIARSAGAKVTKNDDGVYVFEPEAAAADGDTIAAPAPPAPAVQAPAAPPAADNRPESQYPPGSLHWYQIVLQHEVPSDILKMMRWDQDLVEMTPFKPVDMPQQRPNVSSSSPSVILPNSMPGYGNGFSPNAGYQNNGYPNNGYQNSGDPSVPIGTGNSGPAGANYSAHRSPEPNSPNQANQFPFGGGGGFPGGGGGGFPGGGGGFPGGGGGFPGGGGGFPGGGGGFPGGGFPGGGFPGGGVNGQNGRGAALPDGIVRIFALQSNNSLLVEASNPTAIAELRRIIKFLDVAPRQVQIKVEFVTASVVDVDNLGVNFDLVPYPGLELATSQGNSTLVSGVGPTFLQYATGNIVAQLYQTLTRTRGKVVQAPIITTTNNVPASINISNQIPFFTTQTVATGGLNNTTFNNTTVNFLTVTTGLTIQPRINSDDSVTMNLTPQISDVTGQPAVTGGPPPTSFQTLNTLRTVRSGDTMVLGGLVRKQETSSTQRIPILSDLPILGGLFRTRNKQVNDSELLIFVTPTIIGESNDSATANANGGQSVTVSP